MGFKEMSFEERKEYFRQRIRGGEKSAINRQRTDEAKEFHKRFYEKMKNKEIEDDIGKEPGE